MNDAARGIYKKYRVYRENDPRGKHNDCDYFVLDLVHDKFAWPALVAYASSCQAEYPELAKDLWSEIGTRAPTGKDKARNPVVELERELSVSQAELAKAQEQLVIIDDSFERLTQMNLSNIDKLDEANEQLAHYAEVSNGLPEEPYHSNDCPYEKSCGKAAATDCTCDLPDRKARYDKEIRDHAIALAASVRDLREQYSDTLLRLEKAEAERDAAVRLIRNCQDDLATWIVPDSGISDHDVLNTLLGRLDGPEARAAIKAEGAKREN